MSVHAKVNGFLLRSSFPEKPIFSNSTNSSISFEIGLSKNESLSKCSRYGSLSVTAIGKNNPGNGDHYKDGEDGVKGNNPSRSNKSGNNGSQDGDHYKDGEDGVKGNNPSRSNKSGNNGSQDSKRKPLDWREFRSLLYTQEMAEYENSVHNQEKTTAGSKNTPLKWAHPISEPENGCLLIATEQLDGVRTFERTVILLLRSGTRNPQEGPFGVVINRPLNKNMKHMNPTNIDLATTFVDCSMHFGGPLDASMFLVRAPDISGISGFQEVINGVYFGSRNSLDEASGLVKKGLLSTQDFRFFIGYAGWQLDQLRDEIEYGYWHVAACSANLIFGGSQNYSSNGLWGDILQLMGGQYSDLSRYPKQDF